MAVAVALLVIGGEFDLSAGVMTSTTGLIAGMLATQLGWSIWLTVVVALVFALVVGYLNRLMVIKTGLPSFNEFFYIIAAVIGGCLLTGGYGSAILPAGIPTGSMLFWASCSWSPCSSTTLPESGQRR